MKGSHTGGNKRCWGIVDVDGNTSLNVDHSVVTKVLVDNNWVGNDLGRDDNLCDLTWARSLTLSQVDWSGMHCGDETREGRNRVLEQHDEGRGEAGEVNECLGAEA